MLTRTTIAILLVLFLGLTNAEATSIFFSRTQLEEAIIDRNLVRSQVYDFESDSGFPQTPSHGDEIHVDGMRLQAEVGDSEGVQGQVIFPRLDPKNPIVVSLQGLDDPPGYVGFTLVNLSQQAIALEIQIDFDSDFPTLTQLVEFQSPVDAKFVGVIANNLVSIQSIHVTALGNSPTQVDPLWALDDLILPNPRPMTVVTSEDALLQDSSESVTYDFEVASGFPAAPTPTTTVPIEDSFGDVVLDGNITTAVASSGLQSMTGPLQLSGLAVIDFRLRPVVGFGFVILDLLGDPNNSLNELFEVAVDFSGGRDGIDRVLLFTRGDDHGIDPIYFGVRAKEDSKIERIWIRSTDLSDGDRSWTIDDLSLVYAEDAPGEDSDGSGGQGAKPEGTEQGDILRGEREDKTDTQEENDPTNGSCSTNAGGYGGMVLLSLIVIVNLSRRRLS